MGAKKKKDDGAEGGKAKSSKLNKMNEMDRVKYLERKLAEEEESKRRKEEMVGNFLKLKLGHEERSVALNKAKIMDQWRNILRKAKTVDLRRDVLTLREAFERALEKKRKYIDSLMMELDEAEEQYAMAFRSQILNIENMTNIHERRIADLLNQFNKERDNIVKESNTDKDAMLKGQKTSEDYLNDVKIALEQNHVEVESGLRLDFQARKDEVRNRNLEELTTLKNNMEETIDSLWQELHNQIYEYTESTHDKRRTYGELLAKDKKGAAEVTENTKKIQLLTDDIADLKQRINEGGADVGAETIALRREKEECTKQLHEVRRRVSVLFRNHEHAKLRRLAVDSHNMLKNLTDIAEEQDHLVKLSKLVQRVATQQDIALTLHNPAESYLNNEELAMMNDLDNQMWDPQFQINQEFRNLEPIWRKLNKAELDYVAMKRELSVLNGENNSLKEGLRRYLEQTKMEGDELSRAGINVTREERKGNRAFRTQPFKY